MSKALALYVRMSNRRYITNLLGEKRFLQEHTIDESFHFSCLPSPLHSNQHNQSIDSTVKLLFSY